MPEQASPNARLEEIYRWFGQGFEIAVYEPTPEEPRYQAVVEEFGLVGEGDTFGTAFDAVMDRVADFLDKLLHSADPLPERSERSVAQRGASDSGSG